MATNVGVKPKPIHPLGRAGISVHGLTQPKSRLQPGWRESQVEVLRTNPFPRAFLLLAGFRLLQLWDRVQVSVLPVIQGLSHFLKPPAYLFAWPFPFPSQRPCVHAFSLCLQPPAEKTLLLRVYGIILSLFK